MIIKNIIAVAMAMSVTAVYAQSEDSDSETSYARGVVNYEPEVARGVINLDANDYEKEENDAQSSVRGVVIDKAKMKEGVDKAIGIDWVICDVSKGRLFTDEMNVNLRFDKDEEYMRRLVAGVYESGDVLNMIEDAKREFNLDIDTEPYAVAKFGKEAYGPENPLFSIFSAIVLAEAVTNDSFDPVGSLTVNFKSKYGRPVFSKRISSGTLAKAREMKEHGYAATDIRNVFASKFSMDAGVQKNKQMVPYEMNAFMTMTDIDIRDNSYVYHCAVPGVLLRFLEPEDWHGLKEEMCSSLASFVDANGLFKKPGSELLELTLTYIFVDADSSEPFTCINFNPVTRQSSLVPLSEDAHLLLDN